MSSGVGESGKRVLIAFIDHVKLNICACNTYTVQMEMSGCLQSFATSQKNLAEILVVGKPAVVHLKRGQKGRVVSRIHRSQRGDVH